MAKFEEIIPDYVSDETIVNGKAEWENAVNRHKAAADDMQRQQATTSCIKEFLQVVGSDPVLHSQVNDTRVLYFDSLGADIFSQIKLHGEHMSMLTAEYAYQGMLLQRAAWEAKRQGSLIEGERND